MGKTDWFLIDRDDNAALSTFVFNVFEPLSSFVRRLLSLVFIVSLRFMWKLPITTVRATVWKRFPFRQVVQVLLAEIRNFDVHIDETILPAEAV